MRPETSFGSVYPDSDGQPMADNTLQYEWIVTIKGNLDAVVTDFVGGDLLWYPVEGRPDIRRAPDVLVALGRPKGHRGSYRQWEEGGVAPQVVFEVLSPGNTAREMLDKLGFYDQYGVEELYIVDPQSGDVDGYVRTGGSLQRALLGQRFTSPRLGITLVRDPEREPPLCLLRPDGRAFLSFAELDASRDEAEARATAAVQRAEAEAQRADRLAARLRALGVDPDDV